ncbi:MAG: DegV family protein [Lachnospiraceae bacterium]|nr:DegV family protein [Lachnospiraceae bacterium]
MSFKIVVDSCCEIPEEFKNDPRFESVPLMLEIGDYVIPDDEKFDQVDFLRRIAEYPKAAKSACPSPEKYMEAYNADAEDIYVVTLSSHLSGSYESANLGKRLYEETYGMKKNIYVVDSESASCGETKIALKICELAESGMKFEDIVEYIEKFRDEQITYFVLDNLETLRKNGRLSNVKALVASTLSIKPVMGADHGVIIQRAQCIGLKKAFAKMTDLIAAEIKDGKDKVIRIAHCNCPDRAEVVKKLLETKVQCKAIYIQSTGGLSTLYANDGGIIVAV